MGFRFQHVPTAGSMGDEPTKHGDSLAMGYDMIWYNGYNMKIINLIWYDIMIWYDIWFDSIINGYHENGIINGYDMGLKIIWISWDMQHTWGCSGDYEWV